MWRWSRDQDWTAEAEKYDARVVEGAIEHLVKDAAVEVADRARLFHMIVRESAETTLLALQRFSKHDAA